MRVVAEIPHSRFKITVFHWNAKYLLKVEIDRYEQCFKIEEEEVDGIEGVKAMVDAEFLKRCMERFLTMREDWTQAWKRESKTQNNE